MLTLRNVDIDALNEISRKISSTKYHYKYDIEITPNIVDLAEKIFKDKSVLLFEGNNADELDNILNDFITILSKRHLRHGVDDEIELLRHTYSVKQDFLDHNNILDDDDAKRLGRKVINVKPVKDSFFAGYDIPRTKLLEYTINSNYADRVDNSYINGLSLYFLTNKITYRSEEKILLSIITKRPDRPWAYTFLLAFLFKASEFSDMESKPIRMFLKILDYYGKDITIHGKTKRFWNHEIITKRTPFTLNDLIHGKTITNKNPMILAYVDRQGLADKLGFIFAIDDALYFRDLKEGKI